MTQGCGSISCRGLTQSELYFINIPIKLGMIYIHCVCVCARSVVSDFLGSHGCSPLDSSAHGISQARTLEWIAISFSRGSSRHRDQTTSPVSSALAGRFSTTEPPGKPHIYTAAAAKSFQSCPTLRDPIDGSPPGSPVPGILQARTLEWVAMSFSNAGK